jgi:lipopolysaccharide transport system ATP-binding protein
MSASVLRVSGIGKAFRKYRSEWQRIFSWFGVSVTPAAEHWVLRGVSFSVAPGEAVGIVGQNGAGKSTLLKLITGTQRATEGGIEINGRIAAILELGMGFNPEFTGRQNVNHAAGLMGFSRDAIEQAMPKIEAFAEIGEYFNQPMRTYSSGMQMRVIFAVATAFRPEILIVDEALSVGDTYFQHKSFDRIRQFKEQGTSLLFVTHSMGDVRALCDRVILLDKGRMLKDGQPDEVVDYYNALIAEKENATLRVEQRREKNGWLLTKSGTGEARIKTLQLLDVASGNELAVVQVGQAVELWLEASIHADMPRLVLGYMIRDKQGHVVWGTNTWHTGQIQEDVKSGELVVFRLPFTCTLGPGSYSISPALVSSDTNLTDNYEWVDNLLVFDVINVDRDIFIGTNWLDAQFSISRQSEGCAQ